jgi:uncharacterized membrane protein YeaQ/YmgE (transglycosylase-associated protein family)
MAGATKDNENKVEALDLTKVGIPDPALPRSDTGPGSPARAGPPEDLGKTRRGIAYLLLAMLGAIIAVELIYAMIYSASCFVDAKSCAAGTAAYQLILDGIDPVFTAMIGLVGSVVGFYFGSQRN